MILITSRMGTDKYNDRSMRPYKLTRIRALGEGGQPKGSPISSSVQEKFRGFLIYGRELRPRGGWEVSGGREGR